MKQADIKSVTKQLSLYQVPVASIRYASEGNPIAIKNSGSVAEVLRNNWEPGTLEAYESFYLVLQKKKMQAI